MSSEHQYLIDHASEMQAQHFLDEFRETELAWELDPRSIKLRSDRNSDGQLRHWAEAITRNSFAVGDIRFQRNERVAFKADGSEMHHI